MPITKSRSSWLAILALLLLSSTTYAAVVGSYSTTGVLNVTFTKPDHKPVKTVSTSVDTWTFKADKTFSRGGFLTGHWKRKSSNVVDANYDRNAYNSHLSNFWANIGVTVSNIRILTNKVVVQELSNGLRIEEVLIYRMDVSENGGTKQAMVSVRGSSVAPNGASENPALRKMFPTMWHDQAATSASSINVMGDVSSAALTYDASSFAMTFQAPSAADHLQMVTVQPSNGLTTQPDPVSAQPDGTPTPQQ